MKPSEPSFYEKPSVEVVILQPESSILQSSSTGAFTQDLDEEDFQWI